VVRPGVRERESCERAYTHMHNVYHANIHRYMNTFAYMMYTHHKHTHHTSHTQPIPSRSTRALSIFPRPTTPSTTSAAGAAAAAAKLNEAVISAPSISWIPPTTVAADIGQEGEAEGGWEDGRDGMREGGGRMGQEGQGGAMNARGLGVGAAGRGRWPGSGLGVERMGAGRERAGGGSKCREARAVDMKTVVLTLSGPKTAEYLAKVSKVPLNVFLYCKCTRVLTP
jgi:hypothetical protein